MDGVEGWAAEAVEVPLDIVPGDGPRLRLIQDEAGTLRAAVVAPARPADAAPLVAALKARSPGLAVMVEVSAAAADDLQRLLEAGADAVVAAGTSARDVRLVAASLASCASAPSAGEASPEFGLTAREIEVLRFLSAGFSNKEVARRLDVSVRTVETHRFNLRRKTQAGRLKDLVHLARRMGLPPASEGDSAFGRRDYGRALAQA
jgi:two-component system, LuxR family, secretion system response regulator SsrB